MTRNRGGLGSKKMTGNNKQKPKHVTRNGLEHLGGPDATENERNNIPSSSKYGYYFPLTDAGYDSSSFNPELSDCVVTHQEVASLIQEVNQLPVVSSKASSGFDPICWWIPGSLLVALVVIIVAASSSDKSNSGTMTALIVIFAAVALVVCAVVGYCIIDRKNQKTKQRQLAIDHVIERHQENVFAGKKCEVFLSKH